MLFQPTGNRLYPRGPLAPEVTESKDPCDPVQANEPGWRGPGKANGPAEFVHEAKSPELHDALIVVKPARPSLKLREQIWLLMFRARL